MATSRATSSSSATWTQAPISFATRYADSAWASVRGKPSSTYPPAFEAASTGLRRTSMTTPSGTRSPRSMRAATVRPSWVSSATCWRSRSPLEMWAMPKWAEIASAWVPLPEPGRPINRSLIVPPG